VGVRNMKYHIILVYAAMVALMVLMPMNRTVTASSALLDDFYQAYPAPVTKPYICLQPQGFPDENNNQKQAAAAALGLYLGLKKATAPKDETDSVNMLCI
jgi:hypothetical protein